MKGKYTTGPWTYRLDVINKSFYIETEYMSHQNTFIGDIGGGLQTQEEIEANAQLVANAPDLLKALEECRADLFYQISSKHGAEKARQYPSIILAERVIKKATE